MNLLNSLGKTAGRVGHQVGQYVDGHASGGLLTYFSTGNVVCLVAKKTGKALQIVVGAQGNLVVDAQGLEGPQAYNTHWTVVNEGNNIIRLHNNNNYLCLNNGQVWVLNSPPGGGPMGAETKFRVAQLAHTFVTIESVKDPGHYVALDLYGNVNGASMGSNERQFIPRLVYTPYGQQPAQPHSYRI